ncbi:hypothetical protein BGW80DRAFT_1322863, partial [Lactifluus volemus]
MEGRAVIYVHCYCPTARPPLSRYYLSLLINPSSSRPIWLLQLSHHDDALIDTEACLLLQPGSFKALHTRACIRLHNEQYNTPSRTFWLPSSKPSL